MLFPVGLEHTTLTRKPLLTYGLMAGLTAIYLFALFTPTSDLSTMKAACDYRYSHPYLEAGDRFEEIYAALDYWTPTRIFDPPLTRATLEQQRQTLIRLSLEGLEELDSRLERRFGIVPTEPSLFGLITYSFLNTSIFTLFMNLVFIYLTMPFLEDRWGRPFTAGLFVVGGMLSGLLLMATYTSSPRALIGSSGAIAVLVGATTLRFPEQRIRFEPIIPVTMLDVIMVPISVFFPLWYLFFFAFQYYFYVIGDSGYGPDYVPYIINIYGFAIGLAVAVAIRYGKLEQKIHKTPFERLPVEEQLKWKIDDALKMAETEKAWQLMREAARDFPERTAFLEMTWNQAVRMGREKTVRGIGKEVVRRLIDEGAYQQAYYHWHELTSALPGENLTPSAVSDLTQGLLSEGQGQEAAELLRYTFRHTAAHGDPQVLLGLIETATFVDPAVCAMGIAAVRTRDDLSPSMRETLEDLERDNRLIDSEAREREQRHPLEPDRESLLPAGKLNAHQIRITRLKRTRGRPIDLDREGLTIALPENRRSVVPYNRILGISAAAIRPLSGSRYLVLDLFADHPCEERARHALLRIESRGFDPRKLIEAESPAESMRALIGLILKRSGAIAIPDEEALLAIRFPSFPDIAAFEAKTYGLAPEEPGL